MKGEEMNEAYSMHGETRNSYKVPEKFPGAKGPVGRHTYRVEDSIKTDLKVEEFEDMDLIRLTQESVHLEATRHKASKFPAPLDERNILTKWKTINCSRIQFHRMT